MALSEAEASPYRIAARSASSPHNAWFEFKGERRYVTVQRFSYSWRLAQSGQSQSRHAYVLYPKRVERTDLSVSLIFRNVGEYVEFGKFMRYCHLHMTGSANPPDLIFASPVIRPYARAGASIAEAETGVQYSVAVKSVPLNVGVDTAAPTMQLTMAIILDMLEPALGEGIGMMTPASGAAELDAVYPAGVEQAVDIAAADAAFATAQSGESTTVMASAAAQVYSGAASSAILAGLDMVSG